jgi:hypothetical protein
MKKLIMVLFLVFCFTPCFADWYIIAPDGKVRSRCSALPNEQDLATRSEVAVFSAKNYPLMETEYVGKKFKQRVKSSKEIEADKDAEKREKEEKLIYEKMRKLAIKELESEGVDIKVEK